ncbi:basic leucine zipper 4-like [Populus alba x Populus x berolinensis]|uniref:Basic leucine zipper 43-like n=3 Tax=Populus TaxID=3689 RepID=A0A4U5NAH4_POPAL|nr:basic leucine zipper 4-like [Populus alba]KAJ6971469.1 basic leucine zipper 4-like [Populus alba x Populus x berolinensis]TKR78961.1 basic leucine zipper 43-like [Populus alba]
MNSAHKYEPPMMQFFPFLLLPSSPIYLAISIAMLSTVSAIFPSVEPMASNPFQSFENGFTPWDCFDPFSSSPQSPKPVGSSSGSDKSNQADQNPDNSNSNSGSDDPNPQVSIIDERKRRRMVSNRESARRSRMRKQKHVENLRNQVNRLRIENRELTNRLRFVLYHSHGVRTDYDRLRSEYSTLRKKLSDIRQLLMMRQLQELTSAWPCNNMITTEQIAPSLITS